MVRIDAIAIAPTYIIFDFLLNKRSFSKEYLVKLIYLAAPPIFTIISYGLFNYYYFHTAIPVSGLSKSIDSSKFNNFGIIYQYLDAALQLLPRRNNLLMALFWVFFLLIEVIRYYKKQKANSYSVQLYFLCACSATQYFYYAIFSSWKLWPWYFYYTPFILFYLILRTSFTLINLLKTSEPNSIFSCFKNNREKGYKINHGIALLLSIIILTILTANKVKTGIQLSDISKTSFGILNINQRDLFKGKVAAYGDRAGSMGYWGDTKIVQMEGLVMSKDFLDARKNGTAEKWLDKNYNIDLYVVDRDKIPTTKEDGRDVYIIIDPAQGRTAKNALMQFCFPQDALLQKTQYTATTLRLIFDYKKKIACGPTENQTISGILSNEGIRKYSLESEYAENSVIGYLEKIDRQLSR